MRVVDNISLQSRLLKSSPSFHRKLRVYPLGLSERELGTSHPCTKLPLNFHLMTSLITRDDSCVHQIGFGPIGPQCSFHGFVNKFVILI